MLVLKSILFIPTFFSFLLAIFIVITSVIAAKSYLGVIKTLFISSYKNHQLSKLYPISFFNIKLLSFITFLILFGFLIQFIPNILTIFDFFIISIIFPDLIYIV
jgi:NADH:ubiquinone oxidoreductase subunit 2 (subunit N)